MALLFRFPGKGDLRAKGPEPGRKYAKICQIFHLLLEPVCDSIRMLSKDSSLI